MIDETVTYVRMERLRQGEEGRAFDASENSDGQMDRTTGWTDIQDGQKYRMDRYTGRHEETHK